MSKYLNVKIRQCQRSECKNSYFLVCQNSESVKITNVSTSLLLLLLFGHLLKENRNLLPENNFQTANNDVGLLCPSILACKIPASSQDMYSTLDKPLISIMSNFAGRINERHIEKLRQLQNRNNFFFMQIFRNNDYRQILNNPIFLPGLGLLSLIGRAADESRPIL